jgi:hypothetical protein
LSAASLFGSVAQTNMIENLVSVNRIHGQVQMQPYYKCYNNISCRPDARINNIILEYKCVDKYKIRQVNKYLEFCNADVILLGNFKTKEFKYFY